MIKKFYRNMFIETADKDHIYNLSTTMGEFKMMQNFYLETDSINSFLRIIKTVIETLFNLDTSEYTQLYLTTKQNMMFRDGKEWIGDDKELLWRLGVESLAASDPRGWSKPKRFFVCTIADYKTDMKDDKLAVAFNDYDDLIKRIDVLLSDDPNQKTSKPAQFVSECGSGYNNGFNEMDGSIDMGFCAQYRPNGAWNNIDISLCHIYYGK